MASRKSSSFNTMYSKNNGFTFIEILMTLAVIGILFVPVIQLFNHSVFATSDSMELITATNLAKSEMERTLNLNLSKTRLREEGDRFSPPLEEAPVFVNNTRWRIKREVIEGSDPLEVRIHVYKEEDLEKPVVSFVTLVEDMMWELVKPIGTL